MGSLLISIGLGGILAGITLFLCCLVLKKKSSYEQQLNDEEQEKWIKEYNSRSEL